MADDKAQKPPPDSSWLVASLAGEGWVRRAASATEQHKCEPPMKDAVYTVPATAIATGEKLAQVRWTERIVDGHHGELWRCRCGQLWRVGVSCAACDRLPSGQRGSCLRGRWHATSLCWRHATWWQRVRHRRRTNG